MLRKVEGRPDFVLVRDLDDGVVVGVKRGVAYLCQFSANCLLLRDPV